VVLSDGVEHRADAVIFNGEAGALVRGLLGEPGVRALRASEVGPRSLSALTVAMRASTEGFDLEYHNVFFQPDYASEFEDVFDRRRLPGKPTLYLCAADRAPSGVGIKTDRVTERLFSLINAPALGEDAPLTQEDIARCIHSAFSHLERCGLKISGDPMSGRITTPRHFAQRFPGSEGALYGMAPHGWMASFRRPGAQTRLPGLFLAGGSAHPGAGVPMATLSGRLAAATAMAHLDSTRRSTRVRIAGGMSTE
jgi:1-hydroxycarotenoid 3,4-desaturase